MKHTVCASNFFMVYSLTRHLVLISYYWILSVKQLYSDKTVLHVILNYLFFKFIREIKKPNLFHAMTVIVCFFSTYYLIEQQI
jgi:hypothetical protein